MLITRPARAAPNLALSTRFSAMTIEQIEEFNSSLIEFVKSYRLITDEMPDLELEAFNENHPLSDVLFEIEHYLESMELLNA